MKSISIILFLIFSIFSYGQINLKGIIIDSITGKSLVFASIEYMEADSIHKGTLTDTAGCFELKLLEKGFFIFKSSQLGYGQSIDTIKIVNDTSIIIKLTQPIVYKQPCRNIILRDKYSLDLPNYKDDIHEYERIVAETEKLGLKSTLSNENPIFVRIWFEPAFEYLGGGLYEISYSKHSFKLLKYRYSSNYLTLIDSLKKNSIHIDNDSVFNALLKFKIYKKENLYIKNNNINIKNMIQDFLKVEDYCLTMTELDRHPVLDGISYHFEIKYMNKYKFISFSNPEYIKDKYEQIDLFLELLNYIHDKFE